MIAYRAKSEPLNSDRQFGFWGAACCKALLPIITFSSPEAPNMKIRPLYDRVVVKRVEEESAMQGGLHIPDSAKEKPQEGEVAAVGKGKRLENGTLVALDVQVGDRILFGKYSGNDIKLDGEEYMIMREDEILGILDKKPVAKKKAS
jgi:chaperonin GroES